MSDTLALATAIAAMDRDALESLVARRRPALRVSDPIGLASELLRPDSIARALAALDRAALRALRDRDYSSAALPTLRASGLVGIEQGRTAALSEVEDTLRDALDRAGSDLEAGTSTAPRAAEDPPDTSAWYATAATAVGELSECLRHLLDRPGRVNRNGTVSVSTARALSDTAHIEPAHATLALAALERRGLVAPIEHALVTTASADAWLARPTAERWHEVAASAMGALPAELRACLNGRDLGSALARLPHEYPLLPEPVRTAAEEFALEAEYLGLAVRGWLSRPAEQFLAGGSALDTARREMPRTAPGIYVQPDLSIVVPGPLEPDDEAVLASITDAEHIGVASTRRVTETSLASGFERGATPESARALFERLSLTGIPQPLEYLLQSLSERRRSIVVAAHSGDEGRTRIAVTRPDLADTLLVDRALHHLQLQRTGEELFSRLRPEHVLAALTDARYPATFAGEPPTVSPTPPVDEAPSFDPTAPALPPELSELVDRVYAAARSGSDSFTRHLELAIRERYPVRLALESHGEQREFTLLPVSLSAGRLRGIDQAAGVERTFPVSLITSVTASDPQRTGPQGIPVDPE